MNFNVGFIRTQRLYKKLIILMEHYVTIQTTRRVKDNIHPLTLRLITTYACMLYPSMGKLTKQEGSVSSRKVYPSFGKWI